MIKWVIGFYDRPGHLVFLRAYKHGRTYTTRLHGKTATQFCSQEDAVAAARHFNVIDPVIVTA